MTRMKDRFSLHERPGLEEEIGPIVHYLVRKVSARKTAEDFLVIANCPIDRGKGPSERQTQFRQIILEIRRDTSDRIARRRAKGRASIKGRKWHDLRD